MRFMRDHTTPTVTLEVMLNLPLLYVFLEREAGAVALKLKAQGNGLCRKGEGVTAPLGTLWLVSDAGLSEGLHDGSV